MRLRTVAILLLALLVRASDIAADTVVHIFLDAANPPFMYATSDQKAAGIYPAIIAEAFSRMGTPVRISAEPWKRALAEMESGMGGIGGIYKTTPRLEKYDYSDELYVERLQVVVLASQSFPYSGLESLRGKHVGVLRGWSYGDAFDQARAAGDFTVEEVESDSQNLAKLQAGRIHAMVATREGADASIAVSNSPRDFIILEPPLLEMPTYLAFAKHARKTELLASFNAALASMRRDGTWNKIIMSILARP
ncbi:substrate-binding periplasmic protein [Fundidesulfovibrio terrae]|uniref:substrate-binding periplasmic protein n=1 Tax=Fundidesulfovibrio terrae TaxID=2922866 RepID=UPI001FAF2BDE|nr:transporter substrate-binding domain-containing protein [Fundidesulfovibrio terrae]